MAESERKRTEICKELITETCSKAKKINGKNLGSV